MLNLIFLLMTFFLISIIMYMLNMFISFKKINDREKLSPFECGFDPLSSSRLPFSMQFYLISIIFLIFDIEIIIFLPMISTFLTINKMDWIFTSLIFIIILIFGLYMEWKDGALSWIK